MQIFFSLAQHRTAARYNVASKQNQMFPLLNNLICSNTLTETFVKPRKLSNIAIVPCKRVSYQIKYRDIDSLTATGDKIRYVRLQAKLTIEELAETIGINRTTLIRQERNQISDDLIKADTLLKIERVCGVPKYTIFNEYLKFYDSEQLKSIRLAHNITIPTMSKILGVNVETYRRWEKKISRPPRDTWQSTLITLRNEKLLD